MEGNRCLWIPPSRTLAQTVSWTPVLGGGRGKGDRRMTDSGRAPGWGVEVPALAGPGGREWRLLVPAAVKANRDGTIKTQRRGVIVQNCVQPTKKKKNCLVLFPLAFRALGGTAHLL